MRWLQIHPGFPRFQTTTSCLERLLAQVGLGNGPLGWIPYLLTSGRESHDTKMEAGPDSCMVSRFPVMDEGLCLLAVADGGCFGVNWGRPVEGTL
jgi:hypothetical protein